MQDNDRTLAVPTAVPSDNTHTSDDVIVLCDLYAVAFCLARRHHLLGTGMDGSRVTFVFKSDAAEAVREYKGGDAVSGWAYASATKYVKSCVHNPHLAAQYVGGPR